MIPTLLIIVTLSFFLMRLAPGGPFDTQRRLPPEVQRNIAAAYDLDRPLYQQYFAFDVPGRNLWTDARRRLMGNRAAVLGIVVLVLLALAALFAPLLSPYPYDGTDYGLIPCAPDWWLGGAVTCRAGGQSL